MKDSNSQKRMDDVRFFVLKRMEEIGTPMNMLEIGFSATPQAMRTMAARGLVKIEVTMTNRGKEWLEKESAKRLRAKHKREMAERNMEKHLAAQKGFG